MYTKQYTTTRCHNFLKLYIYIIIIIIIIIIFLLFFYYVTVFL